MDEEPRMDAEMGERVAEQAYEFWIGPEIERRRTAGELPDDFALHGAQVIFGMDEGVPEVRLNQEVKAVAEVTAARAIERGERVTEDDIAGYKDILLTEDDPNAGHITIVTHKGGWAVAFDFRRNAALIAKHVELARQFLEAAAWAHSSAEPASSSSATLAGPARRLLLPAISLESLMTRSTWSRRAVLIYVSGKAAAFREFARVLRPGGRISLFEPINRFARSGFTGDTWAGSNLSAIPEFARKLRLRGDPASNTDPMLNVDERNLIQLACLASVLLSATSSRRIRFAHASPHD